MAAREYATECVDCGDTITCPRPIPRGGLSCGKRAECMAAHNARATRADARRHAARVRRLVARQELLLDAQGTCFARVRP